jgi:hypothetical protein
VAFAMHSNPDYTRRFWNAYITWLVKIMLC